MDKLNDVLEGEIYHIFPTEESIFHKREYEICDCNPCVQRNEGNDAWLVIHKAQDGKRKKAQEELMKKDSSFVRREVEPYIRNCQDKEK